MIFSFIISIVTFALPITKGFLMLAWGRTVQFLPFFVIGYLFTADNIDFLRFKSKRILIVLVSIIICVTVVFLSCRAFHLLEFYRTSLLSIVDETGVPSTRLCFLKLFVEISAIVLSLAMLTIRNLPSNICKLGRYTLSIYILQIVIIQYGIRFVPNHPLCQVIAALLCILFGIYICKYGLGKWLTNPISETVKQLKNEIR